MEFPSRGRTFRGPAPLFRDARNYTPRARDAVPRTCNAIPKAQHAIPHRRNQINASLYPIRCASGEAPIRDRARLLPFRDVSTSIRSTETFIWRSAARVQYHTRKECDDTKERFLDRSHQPLEGEECER